MSRKRYISTKISLDKRVNHLIRQGGYFAALLYTWMIPHAEDNARLTGDPEEILMTVLPGQQREKTPEDVGDALRIMHDLGLIVWDVESSFIEFPSFYTYQSYVKNEARSTTKNTADKPRETADTNGDKRQTPENAGKPRLVPVSFRSDPDPDPLSLSSPAPTRIHAPTREPDDERETPLALGDGDDEAPPTSPTPSDLDEKRRRNGIKGACVNAWGKPDAAESGLWESGIEQLFHANYTPKQVQEAIPLYEQRRPKAARTPSGLARNIRTVLNEARASPPATASNIPRSSKPSEPTPEEWKAMNAKILDALSQEG